MNTRLTLFDAQNTRDVSNIGRRTCARGEVIFKDIDTGKVLLTTHNKVLLAGSQFVAQKVFNMPQLVNLQTYDTALGLSYPNDPDNTDTTQKICLFCCGTEGCGTESSQVKNVVYTKRIWPSNGDLIPFRFPLIENDIDNLRDKYFGRKEVYVPASGETNNDPNPLPNRVAYYFKAFESAPTMYIREIETGTAITPSIYDNPPSDYDYLHPDTAETFVEMSLQITKEDFREYFNIMGSDAKQLINSISLVTAEYIEKDNIRYYKNILPFTQLNIPNEPLIDATKGIDITYHIYF